jgi:lipoprotein-releasing system permease protein
VQFESFTALRFSRHKGAGLSNNVVRIGVSAVAVSMVVMIISIATGLGLKQEISDKITRFTGDLQVVPYMSPSNNNSFLSSADSIAEVLSAHGSVERVQSVSEKGGLLKTEKDFEGVTIKGVGADFHWRDLEDHLIEGRIPSYGPSDYNDSVLISKELRDRMSLQAGQRVVVFFLRQAPKPPLMRKFIVGGVFSTGMLEFDGTYVFAHDKHLRKLNKWTRGSAGRLEIALKENADAGKAYDELRALLPMEAELLTARDAFLDIFQWIELFDVNIYLILIIMVMVGLVNSVIALLTIILEKKRSIGLLKSLGASERQLRKLFRLRSLHIVGKGMLWGNAIGLGFCLLQSLTGFIGLDPEVYYVDQVPIHLNVLHILLLNLGVLLISYLTMSLPVRVIARMHAVDSLRSF